MSKSSPKQPPASAPAHTGAKGSHSALDPFDEDALHVPKGVSRKTFIFLVGLMIFLMVIWLVPGSILGIASGNKNPVRASFTLPGGEKVEWRASDLLTAHRAYKDALEFDVYLGFMLGVQMANTETSQLTRLMVVDRIAKEAGIEISDADLAAHLRENLDAQRLTPDDFRRFVRQRGLEERSVEETIRSLLRVLRFQQLLGFAGAVPDPAKIEEQWKQENVEYAFDFLTVPVDSMKEEARKELPDDAGLAAWYEKLPAEEKTAFQTEETRTAELARFRDSETSPASELVAAYPEKVPEGAQPTSPEDLARRYYNRVYPRRFAKAVEEGADPSVPAGFLGFDEVREACLAEAPVYFAMQSWIEDLNARHTAGETIDFAAEAAKMGLDHESFLQPLTREGYAGVSDAEVAEAVFSTEADGSFYPAPVALAQGIAVVRTNERSAPSTRPFEEVRDQVAEAWLGPKAQELAEKRLAALRDGLESFEPAPKEGETPPAKKKGETHFRATADAFQAAAAAAGLEVKRRDYLNKASPPSLDALASDEERRTLTNQSYAFGLYNLEDDEVAQPKLSPDKATVYLVRLAGKRDVPIDNMSPTQYDRLKQGVRARAAGAVNQRFDLDFLKANFGLWLYEDSPEAKAASEAAKAAKGAKGS